MELYCSSMILPLLRFWKVLTHTLTTECYNYYKHNCQGQMNVRFGEVFWDTRGKVVATTEQSKIYHMNLIISTKITSQYTIYNPSLFSGLVIHFIGEIFFNQFIIHLPKRASGAKMSSSTLLNVWTFVYWLFFMWLIENTIIWQLNISTYRPTTF